MRTMKSFNGNSNSNQQTNAQAQAQQATQNNQWAPVKVNNRQKIYDYMTSDKFIDDLNSLLIDKKITDELREAVEYCNGNGGNNLVVTPLQVTALSAVGLKPKSGVVTPSQVKFLRNSEIKEYVTKGKFSQDIEKFFMDGDRPAQFVEFMTIVQVVNEVETEVKNNKDELLIMFLNHEGVPFDSFEPKLIYKVFDENNDPVTDKDQKNAYVRSDGWAFPQKK